MKKLLVPIIFLSLILSGCSNKVVSDLKDDTSIQDISKLPKWVLDPNLSYGVGAVGIASPSRGGVKFQIAKAETDAKANIATAINSEISRVTKEALREAKVNDINDVEEVFSQATKEVVKNMPMSGAKRINIYQSSDGTLYIHMVLTNEDYSKYIQTSKKMYENRLKQANLGRDNLDKSQKAVKGLFDELEKERGN